MPRQLAFSLPVREALGREDFFVSPANALALSAVDGWQGWPEGKLVLTGPEGAGKSHLAHVWAIETGASVLQGMALEGFAPQTLGPAPRVVIEDADRIAGCRALEVVLFHLHNHVLASGGRLLLTARLAPNRWPVTLPDLASRMQATATAALEPPDDALLSAVLVKLFADRQITVPPALISYLVARMERSLDAARQMVAALDARALAEGRAITRAMAADLLDSTPLESG